MADSQTQADFDKTFSPAPAAPVAQDAPVPQEPIQTGPINVINPEGNLVSIPGEQLQDALANGYQQATDQHVAEYAHHQKYGTLGQQLKTAAEGAASASTFGLSTGLEKAAGVNPEDIRARAEENPGSHMAGQVAGLVASSMLLPGGGAAGALTKAGDIAAEAVGLGAAKSAVQKIGSAAVRGAAENALFQSGDEVSKMLASQDGHFSETAMADIGLAGLIGGTLGGAIGTVHPLWEATGGTKVGRILKAITDKAGGGEGTAAATGVKDAMDHTITTSGMDLAPEIKAGLSNDPEVQSWFTTLNQSDTTASGRELQESMNKFREDAGGGMAQSLGKTVDEIPNKGEIDKYTTGKNIGNQLADEYHAQVDPLAKEYEAKRVKYSEEPLTPDKTIEHAPDYSNPYKPSSGYTVSEPGTVSQIAEKIAQKMQEENWAKLPDSDIAREVHKVMEVLPKQKTLADLSGLADSISQQFQKDKLGNGPLFRAGGILKSILRDAEADVITQRLAKDAPDTITRFQALRQAYGKQAELKEALDSRLHAKGSTAGYAKSLREMAQTDGETMLRRLSGSGDADMLGILQQNFPKTAELVRDYHINNVLSAAKDGDMIKGERLVKALYSNQMSPQLRDFIAKPESLNRINAISQMLEKFNEMPHNFSNTARGVDKLFQYLPGSATAMVAMLTGHNPVMAGLVGGLLKPLAKDAPDAIKLGLLKFLGSSQPVSAGAFKSTVDAIHSVIKGEALMSKAAKSIFTSGKEVLPESQMSSHKEIERLDNQLKKIQTNPEDLLKVAGSMGHYLPDHAEQMGQIAARGSSYLNSIRPNTTPANPLDPKPVPSSTEIAAYNNALKIAIQPLVIMDKISKGMLTPADLQHMVALYPNLHAKLADKITAEMADTIHKGNTVPYKTRVGLSMFMAQPLDSTMTPGSIISAQPMPTQPPQQAQNSSPSKVKTSGLNKLPKSYQTASQAAEKDRSDRA